MSFMDKAKDKARDAAQELGEKIDEAVDKGTELVDEKSGGRLADQADKVADAAHTAADKITPDEEPPPSRLRP